MTNELGTLLRQLRRRARLTQEQLAERPQVSVSTIRRLETGKSTDHRLRTLHLLAEALEVEAEERQRLTAILDGAQPGPAGRREEPVPTAPLPVAPAEPRLVRSPTPPRRWPVRSGAAGNAKRNTAESTTRSRCRCGISQLPST